MYNRDAFFISTNQGNIPFCPIPKVGQHTLGHYSNGYVKLSAVVKSPFRVAFIREPMDRFLSAYYFFTRKRYKINGKSSYSYTEFVDWALDSDEEHVAPQARFVNETYYNTLIKFDYFNDVMSKLLDTDLERLNATPREADIDESYRIDELKRRYECDYKLYNNARESI